MAGRIPQQFIDDLLARADIVEVINSRVPLKKAGREYKACCPFHGEKTPSFTVSPDKGFYHCFGCGAHGTVIGFLMEFDRLEFVEAIEELAQMLGLEVPREQPGRAQPQSPVAPVYAILAAAAKRYQAALREHPPAVEYLRQRGLSGETARDFGLGYAPAGWDFLLRRLGDTPDGERQLKAAGLILPRDGGGYYDRFRERIMFPIRDSRGRVVGFGGRVLGDGEPKYLNSPETAVFHKGRELYGLYEARQANRRLARILVVEGYMDVASLAEHGVRNAVATLGTATTPEHLRRLFRATPEIVFCFDGDRAGREAAWRALENCLPEMRDGRQVRFLFLPEGEDPDSLVRREGTAGLEQRLTAARPLSDVLLDKLRDGIDLGSIDGRARLAELARPLLAKLPHGVYRELLTERVAEEVRLAPGKLDRLIGEAAAQRPRAPAPPRGEPQRPRLMRRAIQLLLHYPLIGAGGVPAALQPVSQKGAPLLRELLEITAANPDLKPAGLLERFRGRPEQPHLERLLAEDSLVRDADKAAVEFADCLQRIASSDREARLAALVAKAAEQELSDQEREELRELTRRSASGGR